MAQRISLFRVSSRTTQSILFANTLGLLAGGCASTPPGPATNRPGNNGQLALPSNFDGVDTARKTPLGLPQEPSTPLDSSLAPADLGTTTLDPAAELAKRAQDFARRVSQSVDQVSGQPAERALSGRAQPGGPVARGDANLSALSIGSVRTIPLDAADPSVPQRTPVITAPPGPTAPRTAATVQPASATPVNSPAMNSPLLRQLVQPVASEQQPLAVASIDTESANQLLAVPAAGASNPTASMQVTGDLLNHPSSNSAQYGSDPLQQNLEQRIKDFPHDIGAQLDYQLLKFAHQDQDSEMKSLTGLPREDRELIRAIVDGLANFRNAVRADPNMLLSRKVQPMLELADRLRSQADLVIPTLLLCTKVDGWGVYEQIEPSRFVAGKDHMVIVYCEVANFASQQNDRKMWETKLTQETVLYREDGLAILQDKIKTILDISRNRRHDFFIVKMVKLPATLPVGRYVMKVSIQDLQANRVNEASVPVDIVGG